MGERKDLFGKIGISNAQVHDFLEALKEAAKYKKPTEKFAEVQTVANALKAVADNFQYGLQIEYTETAAAMTLKVDDVAVFSGEAKKVYIEVLNRVDTVVIEFDDEQENIISMRFVMDDVFEL